MEYVAFSMGCTACLVYKHPALSYLLLYVPSCSISLGFWGTISYSSSLSHYR